MIIGELTETFPPMLDGVGRVCWAYCNELEKAGHTAYYVAPKMPGTDRIPGLNTILYNSLQIPGQNYRLGVPDWSTGFRKIIREIPFDLVHIHSPFLSARVALEIQKERPNVPIVATFHSKYYDDALKITHSKTISSQIVNLVLNVYNKCDAVWAVNNDTADVLRAYGYRGRIDISENGTNVHEIDYDRAAETRSRLGIPEGKPVLLFVGQISKKKNIQSVLHACGLLKRQGLDFSLLIAGEGPDRSNLVRLTHEEDLEDRAFWLGFVRNGDELSSLYALADLFVFPSLYDNAPMVVREAAANGTPSVLIRGSCSAEGIEDGLNGFLCGNSPEEIAGTILEALPKAKEVGRKARETIPRPWSEIMTEVIQKYEELIQRRNKDK